MKYKYLLILTGLFLYGFCLNSQGQEFPEEIHLRFIQTTDVHGALLPYDYIRNVTKKYSLASVASFVEAERKRSEQDVILLDNGDILQGQPIVYFSNYEKTDSLHVCAAAMNFMKYDAATIGNHDIEAGHAVYDKLKSEFNFPWMAANAINKKTGKPYFEPYTIIQKRGIKIAILGLITPAIPKWLPEKMWEGIEFEDMLESAKKWVEFIKQHEQPDIIVGLFHSGVDFTYDNETDTTFKNENASRLIAEKVKGFDIVFAGHDHQKHNELIKNESGSNVLLINPSSNAQYIAVADINLKWNNENHSFYKVINGNLLDTKDYPVDSIFVQDLLIYHNLVNTYINRVIGNNRKIISAKESLFGNSEFIDLIHQVQMEISGAEISFAAPLNSDFNIPEGPVTVRDMFKLYRFENQLYKMTLKGQEIKDFLEYSSDLWFNQMKSQDDQLLKYHKIENGKYLLDNPFYNFSSAAGIIYTLDVSKPVGYRINIISLSNGKKFKMKKKYSVAINSYTGNGGGGHLTTGSKIPKDKISDRIVFSTDKDIRYYMMKYIEKRGFIDQEKTNNWKIIPEEWYKAAKEIDLYRIFPSE